MIFILFVCDSYEGKGFSEEGVQRINNGYDFFKRIRSTQWGLVIVAVWPRDTPPFFYYPRSTLQHVSELMTEGQDKKLRTMILMVG